ncbi:MAG: HD domain-containing protein [Acholeplasmataceae bacterium]
MAMISELVDGERVSGQFLIGNVTKGTNNFGSNYMSIELRDASGSIPAKKWDSKDEDEALFATGNVVYIEGDALKYKDTLQIKILTNKAVSLDDVDVTKFIKAPPIPLDELWERFNSYVSSIKNPDCQKILAYFIDKYQKKLQVYPAGVSVHHEYASGLLVHITSMAKIADFLASLYDDVDRDILITGVLLHDLGKLQELEGPVVYHYTLEGKLLGHISLMVSEIRKIAEQEKMTSEVPLLLEHMVLSHHAEPEFGSPVPPLTKEAILLSLIDNLDSKMVITCKALETVQPGDFSPRIFPLDGRMLYKPLK